MRVFPKEVSVEMCGPTEEDHPYLCGWALSSPSRTKESQKEERTCSLFELGPSSSLRSDVGAPGP